MARGINKAIIIGTLGKDPEIRHTASGTAVCNFSVATNEEWKDKQSGEKQEKTEWHNIVMWGKLAELAGQYLQKGKQVYLEGKIQTRKWQDKEGKDRYTTEINCHEMQFLGGKGDGSRTGQETNSRPAPPQGNDSTPGGDGFDDIPF